jgi:hypothetical protein
MCEIKQNIIIVLLLLILIVSVYSICLYDCKIPKSTPTLLKTNNINSSVNSSVNSTDNSIDNSIDNNVISNMLSYQDYTSMHYPTIIINHNNTTEKIGDVCCLQATNNGSAIVDMKDKKIYIHDTNLGVVFTFYQNNIAITGIIDGIKNIKDIVINKTYKVIQQNNDKIEIMFTIGKNI